MTSATDRYHHGDLPNALRRAAVEVIEERGVGGFSLREVARRAGVSHTAPAHHFGDTKGLLTSVAEEGFEALFAASTAAIEGIDDPTEQLIALGHAYIALAQSNRGHIEVMFRTDIVDTDDEGLLICGLQGYGVLESTIQRLIDERGSEIDHNDATWMCWSMIQGLVQLTPKITMIAEVKGLPPVSTDELVTRFVTQFVRGL